MFTTILALALITGQAAIVPGPPQPPVADQSAEILPRIQSALKIKGVAPWSETLAVGTANIWGIDKTEFRMRFQPGNRFLTSFTGEIPELYGGNGKAVWKRTFSGTPRPAFAEDEDEILGSTWLITGEWLSDPTKLKFSGSTVALTLPSGNVETIVLDQLTFLPVSASFTESAGPVDIKISGWQQAGAIQIPSHIEIGLTGITRTIDIGTVSEQPAMPEAKFGLPGRTGVPATFDNSIDSQVPTIRAKSGHLLVRPTVMGKDLGWFIVDSGAGNNCIDPIAADEAGLGKIGKVPLTGIGGTVLGSFRRAGSLTLGPQTIHDFLFAELDLAEIGKALGVKLAGILGDEFFDQAIIGIDVNKPSVEVTDPKIFQLEGAPWLPLHFVSDNPTVEAKYEGNRTGWFRLDTGDTGTVTFHAPAVAKEHLLDGRKTTPAQNGGVGGNSDALIGSIEWFELAGHRFDHPEAVFSLAKVGAFADAYNVGNLGQALMKPFTVYFDFGHRQVAFKPFVVKK
jgi:Aspartyl protease